ncbi:serine hydrolase [Teredinibacter franksiae]|uniref:serine hydrolase n=1 Tax=Teredinibacter franksiae TaxID=2761453 RepID=UPI00162A4E4F|nr:serine hydrolase [Teredinibacter franksiae]
MKVSSVKIKALGIALSATIFAYATGSWAENDANLSLAAAERGYSIQRFDSIEGVEAQSRIFEKFGSGLVDLEVFNDASGAAQFVGVWQPGNTDYLIEENVGWNDFESTWSQHSSNGYRLKDVDRISNGGSTTYYSLFNPGVSSYSMYAGNWADFTNHWADVSANDGLRLIDVDVQGSGSTDPFLGTYIQGGGGYAFYSVFSYSTFLNQFNQYKASGLELIDVDINLESGSTLRYTGVWRPGGSQGVLSVQNSWDAFKQDWASKVNAGYQLIDMDVGDGNSTNNFQQFIASYKQINAPTTSPLNPDVNVMGDFLENLFTGPTVVEGMSYAFSRNGQVVRSGASGNALRAIDSPSGFNVPMTSETNQTLASVSKMLTSPLVHRLLRLRGIDVNAPIADWLPAGWTRGSGFGNSANDITFKQLLNHTSGLSQAGFQNSTRWSDLQTLVANSSSTTITSPTWYSYANANYALLRVLIPALRNGIPTHSNVSFRNPVDGANTGIASTWQDHWDSYSDYVRYLIADDFSIPVTCDTDPQLSNEALFYQLNNPGSGVEWSTAIFGGDDCGGHQGLRMSAQNLVQYWDRVRYDDTILNEAERNRIRGGQGTMPGWASSLTIDGTSWYAVGHNGGLGWGDSNGSGDLRTCLLEFPGDITGALILNSLDTTGTSVCQDLRDAYEIGISGLTSFSAVTLEAENATVSGAAVENQHSGYSGSGYVNTTNSSGNWIEFDVNTIPYSGIYRVEIRYANGSTSNRPLDIAINGTVESTADNFGTGAWATWSTTNVNIPLEAGDNKLRLIGTGSSGAANIDRIVVTKVATFSQL